MPWPDDITLTGDHVTLEPLRPDHLGGMRVAAGEGGLHQLWYTTIPDAEGMEAEIDRRLALRKAGAMMPFAVLDPAGR